MAEELHNNWRFYICIALIFITNVLGSTGSYNNTHAACERGNPLRSVVYNLAQTASEKATHGKSEYRAQLERLQEFPVNANGEVDCDSAVVKPFFAL